MTTESHEGMGDFVNSTRLTIVGWLAVAVLVATDCALVVSTVTSAASG
jgi:Mn2+/Fe2+ NRAMP family transporter